MSDRARPVAALSAQWIDAHQQSVVGELVDLLSIPNVAADRANIRRNAEHLRGMLAARGFTAEILETAGNPLVYGELTVPGATRDAALLQPLRRPAGRPEGLAAGRSVHAGSSHGDASIAAATEIAEPEDRRQVRAGMAPLRAVGVRRQGADRRALRRARRAQAAAGLSPTWNVRVILDGEEEASSPSLVPAIAKYRDKLRADVMVILDGPAHSSGRPTVAYGARGIVTLNLTVFGPKAGVHSGNYGNWVPNPAQRLAALLATMKDDDGRVLVAGFNDGIQPLTAEERAMLDAVPDDSAEMLQDVRRRRAVEGVSAAAGRAAVSDAERPRPGQRARRRRRAHDHPRPRDRGDGHPAGQGNAPGESRRQAARARPRAGLPPRRRRADRCRPRRALEAGRDCGLRVADERLPHVAELIRRSNASSPA